MEKLFITAFGMSLIFAAQPGVIALESFRRGVQHGYSAALHVELGSLIGDATWAFVALLGASFLFHSDAIAIIFGIFGCLLLLYFAWDAWRSRGHIITTEDKPDTTSNAFIAGVMLSLSNPQNLTFWLGMSGIVIGLGFLDPRPEHLAVFFVGFMMAQLIWCFFFAALVSYSRGYLNARTMRIVNVVTTIVLGYLGVDLLIRTLQLLPELL
ncbi:MAG: chemotaxis protein [Chloroflexi bacterium]|nr:MAG: chemotaxis protein [Chloroflexota bacterium]